MVQVFEIAVPQVIQGVDMLKGSSYFVSETGCLFGSGQIQFLNRWQRGIEFHGILITVSAA
ncbi:hypothetical protein D7V83_14975 [bacterium 0.1xD8-71]|nr:hypothetical protein D7V83_14975 [bacterium 0.1xD8-71]